MENIIRLNTPQQNRVIMIQEIASAVNNYIDCDVIQDAKEVLADARGIKSVLTAIDYLMQAINYRIGHTKELDRIQKCRDDIVDYTSLLTAIHGKNETAIRYFNQKMQTGAPTRII